SEPSAIATLFGNADLRRRSCITGTAEASVQVAANTVANTEEAGLDLWTAFMFQKDDPGEDHAQPVGEPDEQHRPISAVIEPKPKKHQIAEIKIPSEGRVIGRIDILAKDMALQTFTHRMVDDAVAVHEDFISGATDPVGIFDISIIEGQILPA